MAEHRWNEDHGPDGLYDKFEVRPRRHPERTLGADGEFVFVLRPERDRAAWVALREYAHEVEYRSPNLARQLREHVDRIERRERG
jgi:hypothetical protein